MGVPVPQIICDHEPAGKTQSHNKLIYGNRLTGDRAGSGFGGRMMTCSSFLFDYAKILSADELPFNIAVSVTDFTSNEYSPSQRGSNNAPS